MKKGILKIKITLLLALALIVSFCMYALIIKFYVDPYLEDYSDLGRSPLIFEFYNEQISRIDSDKIYYWGPSSIKEDIDAGLMDSLDNSFSHYNLGNPASTPLRRVVELKSAIDSKPKAVVLGWSYMSLSNNWLFPHDQYALISKYVDLEKDPNLAPIYNETFKELLSLNRLDLLLYKKKFIYVAANKWVDLVRSRLIGSKKPYFYKKYNADFKSEGILLQSNTLHDPEFMKKLENKTDFSEYNVPSGKNIEKLATEFVVLKLLQNRINVIIVKIPLNPELLKRIPDEYKTNFDTFLDEISEKYDVPVLDYTSVYGDSYFYDGHHLNKKGKEAFSKDVGLKVIQIISKP